MKQGTIIWILVYAGAGYAAYHFLFSKSALADAIIKNGKYSGPKSNLMQFGTDYLRPWAKAAKKGQPTFVLNGKTYKTDGGRAA